jgi:hypothetical protein
MSKCDVNALANFAHDYPADGLLMGAFTVPRAGHVAMYGEVDGHIPYETMPWSPYKQSRPVESWAMGLVICVAIAAFATPREFRAVVYALKRFDRWTSKH